MCKLIAELVGVDKQVLSETFGRLERHTASPGIDVRLTGELYGRLHMKMRELGLDPNDTTPHELYQSLINLAQLHDSFLAKRLGIDQTDSTAVVSEAVVRFMARMRVPKHSWSLKPIAAKKLLKNTPPKQVMKLLHYRSLDSMLKRESPSVLLAVARHIEPATWQQRMTQSYAKLSANDFEVRDVEVVYAGEKRWEAIAEVYAQRHRSNMLHNPESGIIVMLPTSHRVMPGLTLASLLLAIHYLHEIRTFSTYFKFHHMQSRFALELSQHLAGNQQNHVMVAGHAVHWRIVHRYYGMSSRLDHPEIFEPHVQADDLYYRKAEELLFKLEPALHFWHNTDYVGLPLEDGILSFNLTDVAMNLVNRLPFEHRVSYHLRDALWNEIFSRYIGQRQLERQVLLQLEERSGAPALDMEFVW